MLLATAWQAVAEGSSDRLMEVAVISAAMRGTVELAKESVAQGEAFLDTAQAAWPDPALEATIEELARSGLRPALPVSVAVVSACHGVPLEAVLPMYLQSFAAGIVSAGVRLIPIGQTDGQRVLAELEPICQAVAGEAVTADLEAIGSATFVIDMASMRHETQAPRLFRS